MPKLNTYRIDYRHLRAGCDEVKIRAASAEEARAKFDERCVQPHLIVEVCVTLTRVAGKLVDR